MPESWSPTATSGSSREPFSTPAAGGNGSPVTAGAPRGGTRAHLITVALEDYYQTFPGIIRRSHWYRFETRVEQGAMRTLDLLDECGVRATFFTLGWTAARLPEVIREVARRGHEVAAMGYSQRPVDDMSSPEEFRDDLVRAREEIESASGRRVVGYRAPGWLRAEALWMLEVLAQEGFAYDSSVKPLFGSYAHQPWRRFAHPNQFGERVLWEFPISSLGPSGLLFPIGAGNYFRQLPSALMQRAVAYWDRTYAAPFMMYFHTWELDPEQPQITGAPLLKRVRVYRNLQRVPGTLQHYFEQYAFTGVASHLGLPLELPVAGVPTAAHADEVTTRSSAKVLTAPRAIRALMLDHPVESPRSRRPVVARPDAPVGERTSVTLVVPCYNEEIALPYLANTLESVVDTLVDRYHIELIFVDDCSTDGTLASLHRIFGAQANCTVLAHASNQGAAKAILTGIHAARTEIVCSIDCDCTYDPHELRDMIPLLTDGVDLVTGSPYHRDGTVRNVPAWRLALSKSASALYRLVLRQKLGTYTSFFRVYRRSAMLAVHIGRGGYLGIAEMLGRLDLAGAQVAEYPTTLNVRMLGHSKMKVMRTMAGHLGLLAELALLRLRGSRGATPQVVSDASPTAVASRSAAGGER